MTQTPELAELLRRALESRLLDLFTALPGKVESYDATRQVADVKPMVKRPLPPRRFEDGQLPETLPVIPSVPVVFPRAGDFFMSFPMAPGDFVLLVFLQWDPSQWRDTGEDSPSALNRKHHPSHAICIPGLFPKSGKLADAHASNMAFGKDGGFVAHVTDTDIELPAGASEFLGRADRIEAELQAIADSLAAANTPPGTAGGPLTWTPPSGQYTGPGAGATASDKVKGE